MTEKNAWDIRQLIEWKNEMVVKIEKLDSRMRTQELFKESTVQQLIIIFERLKELQEGDKWIKRMFITALVGTGFSAVGALIVWAIQR